jgi:hypothetical protein
MLFPQGYWKSRCKNESAPDSIGVKDARSNSPPPKSAQSQASLACGQVEWLRWARGSTEELASEFASKKEAVRLNAPEEGTPHRQMVSLPLTLLEGLTRQETS